MEKGFMYARLVWQWISMYYILWFLRYWSMHWILPWIQHMHVSLNACDALNVVSWILKLALGFRTIEFL